MEYAIVIGGLEVASAQTLEDARVRAQEYADDDDRSAEIVRRCADGDYEHVEHVPPTE